MNLTKLAPNELHTVGLWWDPQHHFKWYVNGSQVFHVNQSALAAYRHEAGNVTVGQRFISREASYLSVSLHARGLPETR